MLNVIRIVFAPLLSLFIFVLGNGLFTTFLTIKLHYIGSSALVIGVMMGLYYAGLASASFKIEHFILRVGHIRAFAVFASLLSIITLLNGILINHWFWAILRFSNGFVTAGLFIIVESWLLILSTEKTRGQILALYMVTFYAAQALGQFLINLSDLNSLIPFAITSILCSLSIIPLATTKIGDPKFIEPSTINFKDLYKIAASGIVGCICSGLILGAIYGLLPLYIAEHLLNNSAIGFFMALTIFGGMFLQYPIGILSDYMDRRKILLWLSILIVLISLLLLFVFHWQSIIMLVIFIFGGLTFTLYPVSISHACDHLATKDIVAGTQGLLLAYSIGATLGPIFAALFVNILGSKGLLLYFILIGLFLSFFLYYRQKHVAAISQENKFISIPQTSPITAELDPRGESG
jgi:MFS family permease